MNKKRVTSQMIANLDDYIMSNNPDLSVESNPQKCIGLNSYFLNMRQELHSLRTLSIDIRRGKLKHLLIEDFNKECGELAEVDLGYINTQP